MRPGRETVGLVSWLASHLLKEVFLDLRPQSEFIPSRHFGLFVMTKSQIPRSEDCLPCLPAWRIKTKI